MPPGLPIMVQGVPSVRSGVPLAAAAGSQCCCKTPGGCVPQGSSCGCGPDPQCERTAGVRELLHYVVTPGGSLGLVHDYQVPQECCCRRDGLGVSWSAAGSIVSNPGNNVLSLAGSGSGPGFITVTTRCEGQPPEVFQYPFNPTCNLPTSPVQLGGFPCFPFPSLVYTSAVGSRYRDCTSFAESGTFHALNSGFPITSTGSITIQIGPDPNCVPPGNACGACCCGGRCFGGLSPAQCAAMGGTHQGPGSSCLTVRCPASQPVLQVACCLPDGS